MAHAVNGISSLDPLSNAALTTPEQLASPVKAPASPAPQQEAPPAGDQVTLSVGAQAAQLAHSGQSVAQIAVSLGVSAAIVDSYLGIAPASSAAGQTAPSTAVATAAVTGTKLA